jgi:hypothetical protein
MLEPGCIDELPELDSKLCSSLLSEDCDVVARQYEPEYFEIPSIISYFSSNSWPEHGLNSAILSGGDHATLRKAIKE